MEPPRKKFRSEQPNLGASLGSGKDFRKHKKQEAVIDESVYDYDGAYDAMQEASAAAKAKVVPDEGPRYMNSILAATETRKRDQLTARDKILAKEREAEGDEFRDKETFVTGAYKEQQEQVRRAEEEEKKKEELEEDRARKEGGGMRGFYKDLLGQEEERHRAMMGISTKSKNQKERKAEAPREKTDAEVARELNERGANIVINDDGQVGDKRQLLKGGLNVVARKKIPSAAPAAPLRPAASPLAYHAKGSGGERSRRERQTRMLEAQLEESARQAAEEEAAEQEKAEEAAKSKKTKEEVSSAKERYLQRKREAAAAAAGQNG